MLQSRHTTQIVFICSQGGDEDEEEGKKKKQARKITGKCWMAEQFPMSLKNLLPLLDVIGNANKHLARVGNFLQKYGNKDLFPVKLQVLLHLSPHSFAAADTSSSSQNNPGKIVWRTLMLCIAQSIA